MKKLLSDIAYYWTIAPRLKRLQRLLPEAKIYPAGSRYVCSPPKWFTDIDFLVYGEISNSILALAGYKESTFDGYFGPVDDFTAWRKGSINLVVSSKLKYVTSFNLATHICKSFNVMKKFYRIVIHQTLRGDTSFHVYHWELEPQVRMLLINMIGPHGAAIRAAYRAKHGLME